MGGGNSTSTSADKLVQVSLQSSCYGNPIPFGYGQARLSPNLIYYNDFLATPHTTETHTGKGGGSSNSSTTFTYSATIMFALCEGLASFGTVWRDKEQGSTAIYGFTTFGGAIGQAPWAYLTGAHPADAIGYSGTALAAMAAMPLSSQATIGNYSFEMTLPYSIASGTPGSPDANPADIIFDFLTNSFYGAGWPSGNIADLTPYRTYCTALGLWLSPVFDTVRPALDHITDILTATNSEAITTGGQLKIIPYGDTAVVANGASFAPNLTPQYDLTVADFIVRSPTDDPVKVRRGDPTDTFNTFPVSFRDRALAYNTNTVQASEPADADQNGLRLGPTQNLPAIKVQSVALAISRILGQRKVFVRNEYTFNLSWRFVLLEPMDLLTLTEAKAGLDHVQVLITTIEENAGQGGLPGDLTITAQEWPTGVAHTAAYNTQGTDGTPINQLVAPGNVNTPAIFDFPLYLVSTGGAAVGVAASGGANWGGCQVWMSSDNATYGYMGTITAGGRYGALTAAVPRTFTMAKPTGANAWDSATYVGTGFTSGTLRWTVPDTNVSVFMGGWASSPAASASYTNLNNGLYCAANAIQIYEAGTLIGTFGSYAVGDTFEVLYNGTQVLYKHNGATLRTVAATGTLYQKFVLDNPGTVVQDAQIQVDVATWTLMGTATATQDTAVYDPLGKVSVDLSISAGTLGSIDGPLNADFANLALVDNELLSYQNAALTSANHYDLTLLYRGVLGNKEGAHANAAPFVRMDDKVLEIPITPARIGQTLYFKFVSFNIFNKALQSLASVSPYTFVPNPQFNVGNTSSNFTANGSVNAIAFFWGSNLLPGAYVVELWQGATANAYGSGTAVKVWEGNATGKLLPVADTTVRYYWIRPRAADGRYGPLQPSGNGIPGAASVVTSAIVLSASPGTATSSGSPTSQTTNSVTVTPTGGTAPYTYAWTWNAGGSGITITSATAASTTFSATGLGLHETRTGTAQCVVHDNIGASQTIFVNVSISETASAVTASASPTTESVTGTSSTETTGSTTVSASGGLPSYTYAWTWQSGGTGITITSASAASTTFSATGLGAGSTVSGTALCTVTDALGQTATATVSVSLSRASTLSVAASPTTETTSGSTSSQTTGSTTATASGGQPGYSYAWTWQSGGSGITINSPSSATTSFTAGSLSPGTTASGTALVTATDALGQTATATVTVSLTYNGVSDSRSFTSGFATDVTFGQWSYWGYGTTPSGPIGAWPTPILTGGKTVLLFQDFRVGGGFTTGFQLEVSGFSSDPGASWLTSVTVSGVTRTGGSATYAYGSGTAQWTWYSSPIGLSTGAYTAVIVHL